MNYLTSVSIRNRGVIEAVLNKYIKKKLPISGISAKAGIILGVAQILFSKVPPHRCDMYSMYICIFVSDCCTIIN